MHVMCHMRRRIHACHVSYEEESCVIYKLKSEVYAPRTTADTSASASAMIVIRSRENVMFASAVKQ
jgi:hypothetical protein